MIEAITQDFTEFYVGWLLALLNMARFENQRWVRVRTGGRTGRSPTVGFIVDGTFLFSSTFYYLFLIAFFIDNSFLGVFYLWLMAYIIASIYVGISGPISTFILEPIFGPGGFAIWAIGIIATYPLLILLFQEVSWFGLFN